MAEQQETDDDGGQVFDFNVKRCTGMAGTCKTLPIVWFGFFKTMKLLLSVLRDFLSGDANLDTGLVGSSSQIFNDDILVPHGSLLRKI